LGWWNMPWSQPWVMQEEIKSELSPIDLSKLVQAPYLKSTWGQTSAREAASIMYKATRIHGVFEQVPEQFRGVFLVQGRWNGREFGFTAVRPMVRGRADLRPGHIPLWVGLGRRHA